MPQSDEMKRPHIMIVERDPLFAEMFLLWMSHIPCVGRVSNIPTWKNWCDVKDSVCAVLTRAEHLPEDQKLPEQFFQRNPVKRVVVLGETAELEVPGCEVHCLPSPTDRNDFLYALGLKSSEPSASLNEAKLTLKERSVVCMSVKGYSLKEISDELNCTVSTVQSYRKRAMVKLGISCVADLCVNAAARGWRDCPCRTLNAKPLRESP